MKPAAYHHNWKEHYEGAIARAILNGDVELRRRLEHELALTRRRLNRAKRKEARQ